MVVDCRWIRHTGIGRVTALLLRGSQERPPLGWTYWGPPLVASLMPADGVLAPSSARGPTSALGQSEVGPGWRYGVRLSLHAVRPLLVQSRSAVLLHDVIPAIHEPSAVRRRLWRRYLTTSIRRADRLMVYSDATAERAREFGARKATLRRIDLTIDPDLPLRVRRRRFGSAALSGTGRPYLLYIGQLKPHKNVPRAIAAFGRSTFARDGGSFVIVGATGKGLAAIHNSSGPPPDQAVNFRGRCSDEELEDLLVGASALILPSLEEGFGLPVLEAQVAGVPALCSDIKAHREHATGDVTFFDPHDIESIANAIDVATAAAAPALPSLLTPGEFAEQIVAVVDELL